MHLCGSFRRIFHCCFSTGLRQLVFFPERHMQISIGCDCDDICLGLSAAYLAVYVICQNREVICLTPSAKSCMKRVEGMRTFPKVVVTGWGVGEIGKFACAFQAARTPHNSVETPATNMMKLVYLVNGVPRECPTLRDRSSKLYFRGIRKCNKQAGSQREESSCGSEGSRCRV